MKLTIEQQFELAKFDVLVDDLSHKQCKEFLKKLRRDMVMQEMMYRQFLLEGAGIVTVLGEGEE